LVNCTAGRFSGEIALGELKVGGEMETGGRNVWMKACRTAGDFHADQPTIRINTNPRINFGIDFLLTIDLSFQR